MPRFIHYVLCRIVPRTTERNYVSVERNNVGCRSSVGMTGTETGLGKQVLANTHCGVGGVIHEFMHAIGKILNAFVGPRIETC